MIFKCLGYDWTTAVKLENVCATLIEFRSTMHKICGRKQ